jgi:hypothetical protein
VQIIDDTQGLFGLLTHGQESIVDIGYCHGCHSKGSLNTLDVLGLLLFEVVDDHVMAAYVCYCRVINGEDTGTGIDIDSL